MAFLFLKHFTRLKKNKAIREELNVFNVNDKTLEYRCK